ncbi:uncharacterized protein C8R40DRAFT_1137029 [Lentinula edodes]|uniref:uncharacterized protein n=1 Tax=Lentinula edodes TaxID=5353 RepID=UPI001E8CE2D0|nr:uncharacterized protein C8R40DRAFT_1137029 [Lentinula edodes]KAH7867866.1 hypothetical protein C8R40DRAFT_1137029 [Lentinula edodes]
MSGLQSFPGKVQLTMSDLSNISSGSFSDLNLSSDDSPFEISHLSSSSTPLSKIRLPKVLGKLKNLKLDHSDMDADTLVSDYARGSRGSASTLNLRPVNSLSHTSTSPILRTAASCTRKYSHEEALPPSMELNNSRAGHLPLPSIILTHPSDDKLNFKEYNDLFTEPQHIVKLTTVIGSICSCLRHVSSCETMSNSNSSPTSIALLGSTPKVPVEPNCASAVGTTSVSSFNALPSRKELQQALEIEAEDKWETMSVKSTRFMQAFNITHCSLISPEPTQDMMKWKNSRMIVSCKPPSIPLPPTLSTNDIFLLSTPDLRQHTHTITPNHSSLPLEHSSTNSSSRIEFSDGCCCISLPPFPPLETLCHSKTLQCDIDTASTEELRKALQYCNQKVKELSVYLLQVVEIHAIEKGAREGNGDELEREHMELPWLVETTPMHGEPNNKSIFPI